MKQNRPAITWKSDSKTVDDAHASRWEPVAGLSTLITLIILLHFGSAVHAGDLNPPLGPVRPTMKTLVLEQA